MHISRRLRNHLVLSLLGNVIELGRRVSFTLVFRGVIAEGSFFSLSVYVARWKPRSFDLRGRGGAVQGLKF